jgi:hypothetical protein
VTVVSHNDDSATEYDPFPLRLSCLKTKHVLINVMLSQVGVWGKFCGRERQAYRVILNLVLYIYISSHSFSFFELGKNVSMRERRTKVYTGW